MNQPGISITNVQGIIQTIHLGDKVRYIPFHANKDRTHPHCEIGIITSWNDKFIFVRYEKQHPSANGQATDPSDLELY